MKNTLNILAWVGLIFSLFASFALIGELGYDPEAGAGLLVALLWGAESLVALIYIKSQNG